MFVIVYFSMWLWSGHLAPGLGRRVLGGALVPCTPTLTTPRQVTNQRGPLEKTLFPKITQLCVTVNFYTNMCKIKEELHKLV